MSSYGWIITKDCLGDDNNEAGAMGPADCHYGSTQIAKSPHRFRMSDGDDIIYYYGRIIGEFDGFEPLDDFGLPNSGCTTIEYFKNGDWETL